VVQQAARQGGFAGPQIAAQIEHAAGREVLAHPFAQAFGRGGGL